MSTPIEAEVKVQCADVDALIAAHPEFGWAIARPRHFEDNYVYDLPGDVLKDRGSILRCRIVDGKGTLTYKGMLPESLASTMKVREELETGVDEPEVLRTILERLGFKRVFRYQKYRTVYRLEVAGGEVHAMRDETPLGGFLELEGDEGTVAAVASALGFAPGRYINTSYIGMQAALCAARGVPLEDLVFITE